MARNAIFGALLVITVGVAGGLSLAQSGRAQEGTAAKAPATQPLRHVVLFSFKDDTPASKLREIEAAFAALPGQVEAISEFEWGLNQRTDDRAHGFTHCFVVTFDDVEALQAYDVHEAHVAFKELVGPHVVDVLIADYYASS